MVHITMIGRIILDLTGGLVMKPISLCLIKPWNELKSGVNGGIRDGIRPWLIETIWPFELLENLHSTRMGVDMSRCSRITAANVKKKRVSKAKREQMFSDLLRICREEKVGVEFEFSEISEWAEHREGTFDASTFTIKIYKSMKEKTPSLNTIFTLSHEMGHYRQFMENLKPNAWLYYNGFLLDCPMDDCDWLEEDADRRAEAFVNGYF